MEIIAINIIFISIFSFISSCFCYNCCSDADVEEYSIDSLGVISDRYH